jgi:hypothetical protein
LAAERRLPAGLAAILSAGITEQLIQTAGWVFTVKGLSAGKGPYRWFSERSWMGGPHPNWEYSVQAAEFVRLHRVAVAHDWRLNFEDDLMDLALYDGDRLTICVEVKERAEQVRHLMQAVRRYEQAVDLVAGDRGNDALRKAKYIIKHKPKYFAAVALGTRLEYRVDYPAGSAFRLAEDLIPLF